MKHAAAWLMALALSASPTWSNEGTIMTDETNVLAAVETMTGHFHAKNIEGVMNAYEGAATVVFEPGKAVSDSGTIRAVFPEWFALNPTFTYSGHEAYVNGDLALHIAPWTMTGTAPDGQAIQQSGLSVAVLRKQADGSWKLVIDNPHGAHLLAAE